MLNWRPLPYGCGRHFIMNKKFLHLVPSLLFLVACGGNKEQSPVSIKLTPESLTAEIGTAHDIQFKVACEKSVTCELADAPWAVITDIKQGAGNTTVVKIHLEENTGEASRTGQLSVSAGKTKVTAKFTQQSIGSLLPVKEITLTDLQPVSLSFKFPVAWTLSCTNEDGTVADWFSSDATGGIANLGKTVNIKAATINIGESERKGFVAIDIDGKVLRIGVTQPVTGIMGPAPGVYNYDAKGGSVQLDPLRHQVSVRRFPDGSQDFRIVNPAGETFLLFSGLPGSFEVDKEVDFTLYQNWIPALDYKKSYTADVVKTTDDLVWLIYKDICFVINK